MNNLDEYINTELSITKELSILFDFNDSIIIFDIGACEAEDSIRYSLLFPNSVIFAFEPNPENIKSAKLNIKQHKISNITLFEEALSDEQGEVDFYVSSGSPKDKETDVNPTWNYGNKSSSILPPEKIKYTHDWLKFNKKITIKANTLNNFCKLNNIPQIDFIHMDVQGAELKVLKGSSDYIENAKIIWLEVSNIELYKNQALRKDIEKFMAKNNFFLFKNEITGSSGDQLYVNRKYFSHLDNSLEKSTKKFNPISDIFPFKKKYQKSFQQKSYSQSGEDLIVKYIFETIGIEKPNYIDIGAHHPLHINNTAIFYENGSRGINIEPNPDNFKLFRKFRKDDINLNIGISTQKGFLDYYKLNSSTLNTFSKDEAEKYQNENEYKIIETLKVEVDSLQNILEKYNNGIFPNYLTLDVEGLDEEILKSIDYERNSPIVICVETISFSKNGRGLKNKILIDFLIEKGYLLYADTYINSIFVKRTYWEKI